MTTEYSGKDCLISFLGREANVIMIKYGEKQDKKNKFVLGKPKPHTQVVGNKEYTGEMTVYQSEFEAIVRSLPAGKSPLDIAPFDIIIVYVNDSGFLVTDIMRDVSFLEWNKEMKPDGELMEIPLPLLIGSIDLNVTNS